MQAQAVVPQSRGDGRRALVLLVCVVQIVGSLISKLTTH